MVIFDYQNIKILSLWNWTRPLFTKPIRRRHLFFLHYLGQNNFNWPNTNFNVPQVSWESRPIMLCLLSLLVLVAATLQWEIPILQRSIFFIKKTTKATTMKLYYLLRDQFTHFGQISDPSVQNFRRKSRRKRIKKIKKSRRVNHIRSAAATLRGRGWRQKSTQKSRRLMLARSQGDIEDIVCIYSIELNDFLISVH